MVVHVAVIFKGNFIGFYLILYCPSQHTIQKQSLQFQTLGITSILNFEIRITLNVLRRLLDLVLKPWRQLHSFLGYFVTQAFKTAAVLYNWLVLLVCVWRTKSMSDCVRTCGIFFLLLLSHVTFPLLSPHACLPLPPLKKCKTIICTLQAIHRKT